MSTEAGQDRFEIRRRLGGGTVGEVFEAFDRQRDHLVALKALRVQPSALDGFEREFARLAAIRHPNLVTLHDLVLGGEQALFTMELVPGESLRDYAGSAPNEVDGEKLRAALLQLASGLKAVHDAGKLHSDLKPSNVLVTPRGRLVLLDAGMAPELNAALRAQNVTFAGTAAYMAPEQARGEPPQPAGDWYAAGVILFELLTGRWPFTGSLARILIDKQFMAAPSPLDFAGGLPADLVDLCRSLLETDPVARPTGAEVIRRLGGTEAAEILAGGPAPIDTVPLVGRDAQLAVLEEAARIVAGGQTMTVAIHGPSGIGKTALVSSFLKRLRASTRALALTGRCHIHEAAPFNAFQGIVDSLSRHLQTLSPKLVSELLPENVDVLTRLFPALLQVEAVSQAIRSWPAEHPDAANGRDRSTMRRQALQAFRKLLDRMTALGTLVLHIDDLHWADADAAGLLRELLLPPDAPPVLLLTCFSSEAVDDRPFLQEMLARTGTDTCRQLALRPLADSHAAEMARSFLASGASLETVDVIVREAAGVPLLIEQLSRHTLLMDEPPVGKTLDAMVRRRLSRLPRGAARTLRTLAAAGRPLPWAVVLRAAKQEKGTLETALRAAGLLRAGSQAAIQVAHERIREGLVREMGEAEVQSVCGRLAAALEDLKVEDGDLLMELCRRSGDTVKTARLARQAASRAASALAFDRATELYRLALELSQQDDTEKVELLHGLADSLAFAGRNSEAADLHRELSELTQGQVSLNYKRCAAMEYLMSGYVDQGLEAAQDVLREVGIEIATGRWTRLTSLLWHRFNLRLRGMRFRPRDAAQIPARRLLRIDTCWAMAAGLEMADAFRAAEFQNRHLLLALESGEPHRVARAMAMEVRLLADTGSAARRRAAQLRRHGFELARELGDDYAAALATLQDGVALFLDGEWHTAVEVVDRAERMFHDCREGAVWEITTARRIALGALAAMGRLAEVGRRLPRQLQEAVDQGNIYGSNELLTRLNVHWLAADDPDEARRRIDEAERSWDREGYHLSHLAVLTARVQADLYTGHGVDALAAMDDAWPKIREALLLRIQKVRVEVFSLHGRSALAAAVQVHERRDELVRVAQSQARRLEKESVGYARPCASLMRAAVAHLEGRESAAREILEDAAQNFEAFEMKLYATAAWRRLGELMGGAAGQELIARSDATLKNEKVRNPAAMTTMLVPGFRP